MTKTSTDDPGPSTPITARPRRVILLGPQRDAPTVRDAIEDLTVPAGQPVAAVTAGWEEREPEDLELGEHLGRPVVNLEIYKRAEDVYRRDPELHEAMRTRHDTLRTLQDLYRQRLAHALDAARELLEREHDATLLEPEQRDAIEVVRALDARHLRRVEAIHAEFDERFQLRRRPVVADHRRELAHALSRTSALCIAGGHVAILLNRVRLFDLISLLDDQPIVAWSAGAMALSPHVVLFHDSPPQGPGDAEVLVPGLAVCPGIVPLPWASERLRLDDHARVALFARRFRPALCAALDPSDRVQWDGHRWSGAASTRQLTDEGSLAEISAA